MTGQWVRWLPAAVVPAVIAVGVLAVPLQAGAAVDLPDKSPAQVLSLVGNSTVAALSGTIEQTSALGLPDLSAAGSSAGPGASSALELLTGSHTARVYLDGPDNVRVQVLDRLAERDLVRQGSDVWLYSSDDNSATHIALPQHWSGEHADVPGDVPTPAVLADKFLAAIDPSTTVTVGTDSRVAGRSAYELVLSPRASGTLVERVSIAVDAETGLPLSVTVTARSQDQPAFQVGFTDVTLQAPDAALFAFEPPAGATVTEQALPVPAKSAPFEATDAPVGHAVPEHAVPEHRVIGTGWSAVLEVSAGAVPAEVLDSPLLSQAATAVPGGRLVHTALVNVLLTDDGRVLAGSVPLETLQTVAAR